jgi:hypothetical protein
MTTGIGMEPKLFFWRTDDIQDMAPRVYTLVPKRTIGRRTVVEALIDERWIDDIQGTISWDALVEYLNLRDMMAVVELHVGAPNRHI